MVLKLNGGEIDIFDKYVTSYTITRLNVNNMKEKNKMWTSINKLLRMLGVYKIRNNKIHRRIKITNTALRIRNEQAI